MGHGGHGSAFLLCFHHQQRRAERCNEPIALQKAIGANALTAGRIFADDAALLLDLMPQHRIRCRVGAVDGHTHHRDGGAVVFHGGTVSGAVQSVGKAADDDCTVLCQCPADVCRCIQAIFCRPAAAHDADRARFIEPARVAGAVEHQRHIRNAGKGQRIIRVSIRQNLNMLFGAFSRECAESFRCIFRPVCPCKSCLACCLPELACFSYDPCTLSIFKFFNHSACISAARAKRFRQPQPVEQFVWCLHRCFPLLFCFAHRLSSRKCHSRMLPAMPAFRLSTRSVMGMRTVLLQAAMVSSVRP